MVGYATFWHYLISSIVKMKEQKLTERPAFWLRLTVRCSLFYFPVNKKAKVKIKEILYNFLVYRLSASLFKGWQASKGQNSCKQVIFYFFF
jgi:hypothetical protein